jgi:putative membrane protein (TIGR04086 family)
LSIQGGIDVIKGLTFLYNSRHKNVNAQAILQGLIWALGINLSVCFILGLWIALCPTDSYSLCVLTGSGAWLGVFSGGLIAGNAARNSGWLHGGVTGFCYGLILFFMSYFGQAASLSGLDLSGRLGLYTISAMAGGIVGVNLPSAFYRNIKKLTWLKKIR